MSDLALRYAAAAEQIGRRARSLNADLMVFTVRMQAYLDLGTPERHAGDITELLERVGVANIPAMYLAAPGRALLAAGDAAHARTALRAFLADPAAMPRDAEWLEAHWALADIALHLDSRRVVAGLFDALRPYESLWAVDGLGDAWPVACDERVAADREALVSAAVEHFGQVDILVNNAGVAYSGPAEDESAEHWQDLIDTNLNGLFALTQLVGRQMLGRGGGVIVNVASPAAAISLDRYGLAG